MKRFRLKLLLLISLIISGSVLSAPAHADWYDGHRHHRGTVPYGWVYDRHFRHYVYAPPFVVAPPVVIAQSEAPVLVAPAPVVVVPQPFYAPPAYGLNLALHIR